MEQTKGRNFLFYFFFFIFFFYLTIFNYKLCFNELRIRIGIEAVEKFEASVYAVHHKGITTVKGVLDTQS